MIDINRQPLSAGAIQSQLIEFMKVSVPNIVTESNSLTLGSFKHTELSHQILEQISWWFFEGEQDEELSKLEKLNNPSYICGHVFKPGEATYSCRECGMDPTCVLCQSCFRKSEHINHKYKFHTSNGGGCCDCGDKEAWRQFYSCSLHNVDETSIVKDISTQLPPDLHFRAGKILLLLMDYVVGFLTVDRTICNDLPVPFSACNPKDTYLTMVYNDETHTFDYVIEILQRAVQCSDNVASDFATIIDREGRTAIKIGCIKDCNSVKDVMTSSRNSTMLALGNPRRTSLNTRVIHTSVIAHQDFSIALLDWINLVASRSDGLRHLISNILLEKPADDSSGQTYATQLMLADKKMWKLARSSYQQVFMSTMLMQPGFKKLFAVEYARSYPLLFEGFLADDHDHSDSISSMSVQLFTVPTIARFLVAEENMLSTVFKVIVEGCCTTVTENNKISYKLNRKKLKQNSNRLEYCFYDLKYFLTNVPTKWDNPLKESFKKFFADFIEFLVALEGMDEVVRKTGHHLEHEPEWESGVTMQMRLVHVTGLTLCWCGSSEEVLKHSINATITKLNTLHQKEHTAKVEASYNGNTCMYVDYDITKKPVSIHYPLTRLLAGLFTQCGRLNLSFTSPSQTSSMLDLAERSFRALALCAQVSSGAWRRNGMGLANQAYYMKHHHCRIESFDRDVQMLQACAASTDPNLFCEVLKRKMNLVGGEDFSEYYTTLYEEFLSIIAYVCSERYCDGIGEVGYDEKVRREIIHVLASGPKPHSKIQKLVSSEITRNPRWEIMLRQVADLKPSTNIRQAAKYELKSECLCEVSTCFYHYTTVSDQSNAQTETIRRKKESKLSTVSVPQPSPPFTEPFKNAINLLTCSYLFDFIKELLQKYTLTSVSPYQWSDRLFEKILYLIGFGIIEERERIKVDPNNRFWFCKKAEKTGVLELLRFYSNNEFASLHRENVCWILNAASDVKRRRGGSDDQQVAVEQNQSSSASQNADIKKKFAMKRRENLIEHMRQMQQKFLEKMLPEIQPDEQMCLAPPTSAVKSVSAASVCTELSWQLSSLNSDKESDVCILCQDSSIDQASFVMSAFAQLSSVLSKHRFPPEVAVQSFGEISNSAGVHVSTCSHVMHFDCWTQFFDSVKERDERRPLRMRRFLSTFSTLKNEFLCPLCSRLSNCIIPVLQHSSLAEKRQLPTSSPDHVTILQWFVNLNELVDHTTPAEHKVAKVSYHVVSQASEDQNNTSSVEGEVESEMIVDGAGTLQPVFDVMIECIRKNCLTGPLSNDFIVWTAAAYTFQTTEAVSRFQGKPIMAPAPVRTKQALSSITRASFFSSHYYKSDEAECEDRVKLVLGTCANSILLTNIFHTFVFTLFSCERLRHRLNIAAVTNDKNLLTTCTLAQIVQIILFIDVDEVVKPLTANDDGSSPPVTTDESSLASRLVQLFNQVRSYAGLLEVTNIDEEKLAQILLECVRPFIRCCALFLYHVTNVAPPDSLEFNDDFEALCGYLGLPSSIASYFDAEEFSVLEPLVKRWCSHCDVASKLKTDHLTFPGLSRVNSLIGLDHDYSDVISKTSDFKCPRFRVDDDSVTPATCLVCGFMFCTQSYCCQRDLNGVNVGACSYHTHDCGFGSGAYLKGGVVEIHSQLYFHNSDSTAMKFQIKVSQVVIHLGRDCTLILLNESRGCYRPAPYLDEFGESDLGLRRGNPLKLDQDRLKDLNLLWLNHQIPETIVRETEANHSLINVDWAHF